MTRPLLPAACPLAARPPLPPSGRRLSVLGAAIAVVLGMASTDASALALGQIKVQSALGEPLRAEVEVTEITAAEADSLKVRVASADAFRTAGVNYNPALSDVTVALQRRADGQYVVRLSGARPLNDPFIDLLLEADAASGRIVRDYTLLLDPPAGRTAVAGSPITPIAPFTPLAPAQQRPVQAPPRVRATIAAQGTAGAAPVATAGSASAPSPAPAPAPAHAVSAPPPRSGASEQQVTVQRGDTAGRIAGAYKPADISLDQMLVALLRANPDAFVGGNVNRMKSGAVLDLPSTAEAGAVPAAEAHRTIIAQSRDFSAYRQRLAENAPTSNVAAADRRATGKLQASVEDRNAAAASPDKLTISQGNAAARAADEKLAQTRQAQESSNRVAELSKNIAELNKLKSTAGTSAAGAGALAAAPAPATTTAPAAATPAPASGAKAPAVPGIPVPAPAPVALATPTPMVSISPPAPAIAAAPTGANAVAPVATASSTAAAAAAGAASPATGASATVAAAAPAVAKPVVKPAVKPAPVERSFFEELLDNPLMLAAAALIALLVAFLIYRVLGRRKREEMGESVFLESRIPRDSFFGASGGELVDTKNRGDSTVSSLSYSPSQLDAGDVDPVAEADVYLAYGRDLQAEEILREALRVNPERTAIHLKLLEIHAKRRDVRAYEGLAADVHKLTGGTGSDWNRVVEMGKELDPGNPLYESGTPRHVSAAESAAFASALAVAAKPAAAVPPPVAAAPPPAFVPSVAPLDFDLDLSQPPLPAPAAAPKYTPPAPVGASLPLAAPRELSSAPPHAAAVSSAPAALPSFDLENDFDTAPGALGASTYSAASPPPHAGDLDTRPAAMPRTALPSDSGFIEFDMSAMADLTARQPGAAAARPASPGDDEDESPHAVKLSLARELQAIGDIEGARSLVEEVEAESAGELKLQAKQLLAELG